MVRTVVAVVVCCGSISLGAATWGDDAPSKADVDNVSQADIGETVSCIVAAKAGRASGRMAAGLTGDWAAIDQPRAQRSIKPSTTPIPPSTETDFSADFDDTSAAHAVAVPLPSGLLTGLPALVIAYVARKRFVRA